MCGRLAELDGVSKSFGETLAIDGLSAVVKGGEVTGIVGPDGAGKTTLLRLIDGLLRADRGKVTVCGRDAATEAAAIHVVAGYMPQRFGLYEDLTVRENLTLYADLRGVVGDEREAAFARLLGFTKLEPFQKRLAGQLSGGMKQKLGLACTLIRKPQLLLLDEPGVGVDPISRRELWSMVYELVDQGIGIVWSTSYLDEAERCGSVLVLNEGKLLYEGTPGGLTARVAGRSFLVTEAGEGRRQLLSRAMNLPQIADGVIQGRGIRLVVTDGASAPTGESLGAPADAAVRPVAPRFEDAFIALLGGKAKHDSALAGGRRAGNPDEVVVAAKSLTKRYGSFTAADRVSFAIRRGEIFGLLGPNGAGKSTIFKMMCGLLRPTAGTATVAGIDLYRAGSAGRARIGYMAQKFSLYGDLSVRQNLEFFAGVYGLKRERRAAAIARMIEIFSLTPYLDADAGSLPLGFKQRLALACAIMHEPDVLFLDEPTSGVDPLTRREFWAHINATVERGVTVMVTTHFMDEAEYCDRVALVYRGRVIAEGSPDDLKSRVATDPAQEPTLEDAFIALVEADEARLAS
jgi:ABC-2 type transport system ATP-binding protein